MKFSLEIVAPERIVYLDDVDYVGIPTTTGEIGILAHHMPLVSIIELGEIRIKKDGATTYMAIAGGFVQVTGTKTTILADAAEKAEEIDLERAERARERAQKLLEGKHLDQFSNAENMAALQRSLIRIKVARRRSTR